MQETNLQRYRTTDWFSLDGDHTFRLNHQLNENSIFFDVGGYKGETTEMFVDKFDCYVYVFEPIPAYADIVKAKFKKNKKVKVFEFGLSDKTEKINISVKENSSSIYDTVEGSKVPIQLIDIVDFINQNSITKIDLIDINIEGSEYSLLDRIISSGIVCKFKNIQIQFHDFVENAEEKKNKIRNLLTETHYTTYQFDYVWENWRRIDKEDASFFPRILEDIRKINEFNSIERNKYIELLISTEKLSSELDEFKLKYTKDVERLENLNNNLVNELTEIRIKLEKISKVFPTKQMLKLKRTVSKLSSKISHKK